MTQSAPLMPRHRDFSLPCRGSGALASLEFGPRDRPIDLVFSHATGFNARTYRSLLAPLADDWRILAVDMRGHGATTLETQTTGFNSWGIYGEDLLALTQLLDLRDVVLAGHSMGGASSIIAAAQAHERVKSLVLFDPVIIPKEARVDANGRTGGPSSLRDGALRRRSQFPSRVAALESWRGRGAFRTWPQAMLEDYAEAGLIDLPDGQVALACAPSWEAATYAAQEQDMIEMLLRTNCPVKILVAEHDPAFRPGSHTAALVATGRIELEYVPGSTHFLPMECPAEVHTALRAALRA